MNRRASIVVIALFMMILTVPTVAYTVRGLFGMNQTASVDELGENRAMSELTDVNLSNLTSKLEKYYNDRVPFRSNIILRYRKANSKLEYYYQNHVLPELVKLSGETVSLDNIEVTSDMDIEELYGDGVDIGITEDEVDSVIENKNQLTEEERVALLEEKGIHLFEFIETVKPTYLRYGYDFEVCKNCGKERKSNFVDKLVDETFLPPMEGEGRVIQGRQNWLYYAGDNSIAYYCGTNILSDEEMAEYMGLMQDLQDACDEKGIELAFIIMPNKEQVYPEYMPSYKVKTNVKREDTFINYVREHSDMKIVYPIEELKAAKKYYETYFPYDTHWTQAGAFIGTMALYKEMGLETTNLNDLTVLETKFTQKGLIDTGSLDESLYTEDIDYVIFYKPDVYLGWFDGEKSFILPTDVYRAGSSSTNKKKLTMIGDSFRLAMIPYFTQDYAEICVAHRHSLDQVKEDVANTDTLIVGSVERFDKYMFEVIPEITEYVRNGGQ